MTAVGLDRLSAAQRDRLQQWFGPVAVVADHSWPLQTTVVLELETPGGQVIVKASAGALQDHHLTREVRAHRELLAGLDDEVGALLHADTEARLLATRHLPGVLAEGSPWEHDPRVLRQAGRLMARLHAGLPSRVSEEAGRQLLAKAWSWCERAEPLLPAGQAGRVRRLLESHPPGPVTVVATHGDFQPRNWLVDDADPQPDGSPRVRLIDFGRADLRTWFSDLVRLHHQVLRERPDLATAFYEGAGRDPSRPIAETEAADWRLEQLGAALGTIAWAHDIGDHRFEGQGHRMLATVLAEADR